jgi:hypothetical protein
MGKCLRTGAATLLATLALIAVGVLLAIAFDPDPAAAQDPSAEVISVITLAQGQLRENAGPTIHAKAARALRVLADSTSPDRAIIAAEAAARGRSESPIDVAQLQVSRQARYLSGLAALDGLLLKARQEITSGADATAVMADVRVQAAQIVATLPRDE